MKKKILARSKFLSKSMRVLKRRVLRQGFKSYERCAERMKPVLLFFKLFGMFANKIREGQLRRCSKPFYVICVFWMSVNISYVCFILKNVLEIETKVTIRMTINLIKHLIGYTSLSVNIITTYSSQNLFGKLFDRLDSYDHEVARIKNERRDNLWIPRLATLSITAINLLLISIIMHENSMNSEFFMIASNIYSICMHIYGTLEKTLLLYLILIRFKHLNEKIAPKVSWNKNQRGSNTIEILNVQIMHSTLYDAQQAFSDIYRNPLLLWFANLMIHVLTNIHIFEHKKPLTACAFVLPPVLQLLTLCTICHYTAEEANKTACALSGNMTTLVNSGQTMKKIEMLMYFLETRVSFNAAGYFTIDLPLFQSIIATVTTYFMILI